MEKGKRKREMENGIKHLSLLQWCGMITLLSGSSLTDWPAIVYQQFMASKKPGGREDRLSAVFEDNRVRGKGGKHISSSPKTTLSQGARILCGFICGHDWHRHVSSCLLMLTSYRIWRDIGKQKVCYPVWIAGIWHSCLTYINFPSTAVLLGGDS